MQIRVTLTENWQNLDGITGVDGTGATVTVTLAAGNNIKGYPLTPSSNLLWYQGTAQPIDDSSANIPIGDSQFYATFDGSEQFYLKTKPKYPGSGETAECILIITGA